MIPRGESVRASGLDPARAAGAPGDADRAALRAAAEEFEAVFIAQMLQGVTSELGGDVGIGAEGPYGDMLRGEYAKMMAKAGGVGVADAVMREMLREQEV